MRNDVRCAVRNQIRVTVPRCPDGGVETWIRPNPGSSQNPARSKKSSRSPHGPVVAPRVGAPAAVPAPDRLITAQSGTSIRRLVADRAFSDLKRAHCVPVPCACLRGRLHPTRKRPASTPTAWARIFVSTPSTALGYSRNWRRGDCCGRTTLAAIARPHVCANMRSLAWSRRYRVRGPRALLHAAREVARHINTDWNRNPFEVKTVAVSGSYMSRRDPLPELSLWVVLRSRAEARGRHVRSLLNKGDALRQILAAMNSLSSFVVVRIVADRQTVQRPFSVVFQASEEVADNSLLVWDRVRDWSASISRRLGSR